MNDVCFHSVIRSAELGVGCSSPLPSLIASQGWFNAYAVPPQDRRFPLCIMLCTLVELFDCAPILDAGFLLARLLYTRLGSILFLPPSSLPPSLSPYSSSKCQDLYTDFFIYVLVRIYLSIYII